MPERILYSWQLITFIVWAIAGKNYETWKSAVTAISGGALAKEICMNKT